MLCAFYLQHTPHFLCTPLPHPGTRFRRKALGRRSIYPHVYRCVCACVRAVVAALPQRYFENCILRFSRGFACFDRVAADFDLMTFQHTHTHAHRARHYQHQRQLKVSQITNITHSLTHSFVHPLTQSASHSPPCAPPFNQSLTLVVASFPSPNIPYSFHVLLSLMSGILRRG